MGLQSWRSWWMKAEDSWAPVSAKDSRGRSNKTWIWQMHEQMNSEIFPLEPHYLLAACQKVPPTFKVGIPTSTPARKSLTGKAQSRWSPPSVLRGLLYQRFYILPSYNSVLTTLSMHHPNKKQLCQHTLEPHSILHLVHRVRPVSGLEDFSSLSNRCPICGRGN